MLTVKYKGSLYIGTADIEQQPAKIFIRNILSSILKACMLYVDNKTDIHAAF